MITRKITLKANDGKGSIVCKMEVSFKERNSFFYGKSDPEILSMSPPGWFKDAVGTSWQFLKIKIEEKKQLIYDGHDDMEIVVYY